MNKKLVLLGSLFMVASSIFAAPIGEIVSTTNYGKIEIFSDGTWKPVEVPKEATPPPNWTFFTETDKITDERWYLYYTEATEGSYDSYDKPALRIHLFDDGTLSISVYWNDYVGSDMPLTVAWRIDSATATQAVWEADPDGQTTYAMKEVWYLFSKLLEGKTFTIRVTEYDKTQITAVFDVSGLDTFQQYAPEAYKLIH